MNILRVGLMCRVSTEEQALHGDSLQAQEELLVKFANDNNMKIYKIYRDAGFSARKPVLKRPAMLELLEDVKAGKIDMVLFTKLDRWFRNVKEYHKIQEILERKGVVWKAVLEDYSTATADGRLKVNIMLSVAENEADRTSERIKFVFNSKIMRREVIIPQHCVPMGYKIVEIDGAKKLVKDEETREMMEYFFKSVLSVSKRQAAQQTQNKYNVYRDIKTWYNVCNNELYTGTYKGVDNYCEPYITQSQFNEISGREKVYRQAKGIRVYLFSGLVRCPFCHRLLISKYHTINNKDYMYYRCPNRFMGNCSVKQISEIYIEEYLLKHITSELEKFILSTEASQPTAPKKKSDTAKLKEQLRRVNVSYQAGNMEDDEYLAKTKEIKMMIEKASLEDDPAAQVDVEALKEFLNSGFEKIYDSLEKCEKQRLWHSIISELTYDGKEIVGIKFKT